MGRFGKNVWAAALWPTIALFNQASHAQAPLCCSIGQSRAECLEQREKYWTQGVVCQELSRPTSPPGSATTITTAPTGGSLQNSSLPLCCTREQSRMECLEQREKNWNQGIACQDPPATSIAGNIATPAGVERDTRTSVDNARPAPLPPSRQAVPGTATATTPGSVTGAAQPGAPIAPGRMTNEAPVQSAPVRINADTLPSAPTRVSAETSARGAPVSAAASGKTSSVPPVSDSRQLPAKSDLPPCCSTGQSKMDCLEERERKLTMGIACQGGK